MKENGNPDIVPFVRDNLLAKVEITDRNMRKVNSLVHTVFNEYLLQGSMDEYMMELVEEEISHVFECLADLASKLTAPAVPS